MSADPTATLLIVDDEAPLMKALHDTLETEGYSATGFTSAKDALAALHEQSFDLVLTDLMMPEMDGISFLRSALAVDPTMAAIVMTGHGTLDTAVQAMQAGALDYILKPFRLSAVLPVLTRSLAVRRVRKENFELQQAVGMYELSKAISQALDFDTVLQSVADTALAQKGVRSVTVLLAGENDGHELHVAAVRGESAERLRDARIGLSQDLTDWLAATCGQDQPSISKATLAAPLPGIPGNASIAMVAAGKFIGIVNFSFDKSGWPIHSGQLKALNILAGAAASALKATSLRAKIREADRQYHRLTENAADIIARYDLQPGSEPRLAYVNQAVETTTGYSPEEFYADPHLAFLIVHPEDTALMLAVLSGQRAHGSTIGIRCQHRNGSLVWIELRAMHVRDQDGRVTGIEIIARDVTDRKLLEERIDEGTAELRRSLIEKTALLKEVHHRVKNNLQVICSLLSMQISYTNSESRPLHDAHSRVLSMSLIHELIYQSDTLADLNFGAYIEALSSQLFGAYCVNPSRIRLELSVEPITLGVDQAIPSGLVLNELLSNALKYAFADGREGLIRIALRQTEEGEVELSLSDNGPGLPENFSVERSQTLGLQVVSTLLRQLGADLTMTNDQGASFVFRWKLPEAAPNTAQARAFPALA